MLKAEFSHHYAEIIHLPIYQHNQYTNISNIPTPNSRRKLGMYKMFLSFPLHRLILNREDQDALSSRWEGFGAWGELAGGS